MRLTLNSDSDRMDFVIALSEDVETAGEALEQEDSPYARRTFIRAVFSTIEGTTNLLKADALMASAMPRAQGLFSPAELAMLREETYGMNEKGEATTQTRL